jgi:predicted nucleic acid-binding protein
LIYIWDTGALSLFFANNNQTKELMKKTLEPYNKGHIPRLILSEFFYKTCQKLGKEIAQVRLVALRQKGFIEEIIGESDVYQIGMMKIKYSNLSIADCVLVQTAVNNKGVIITTEKPITDLKKVKSTKIDF